MMMMDTRTDAAARFPASLDDMGSGASMTRREPARWPVSGLTDQRLRPFPKADAAFSGVCAVAETHSMEIEATSSAVPLRGQRRFGHHPSSVTSFCFPFNCAD
jgi:hypothetical protein